MSSVRDEAHRARGPEAPASAAARIREFGWLLRQELYLLRLRWFWYVVMVSFTPLLMMAFLWMLVGPEPDRLLYVITGSVAQGLCSAAMLSLGQDIGTMKDAGTFEYYASLPISKLNFILAVATRAVILALPSSLVLLAAGSLFFRLPARPSPVVALVLISAGYSLAGLGAFVGFFSPEGRVAGWATQLVHPVLVFLAPVYLPPESLPPVLRFTSRFFPTTYVASTLRASLLGQVTAATWKELAGLAGWTVLSLWIASTRLSWRARD